MKLLISIAVIFAVSFALAVLFILLLRNEVKQLAEEAEQYKRDILKLKGQLEMRNIEAQVKKEVAENVKKEVKKLHEGSVSDRVNAARDILHNN